MDDRLRVQVQDVVEQLLREEKSPLRKTQTFLDIEHLAVEVGDEIARKLASGNLLERRGGWGAVLVFFVAGRSWPQLSPLVPKLRPGNALAQKLCFLIPIEDGDVVTSRLEIKSRKKTGAGRGWPSRAWRRVCSQAGAWEQEAKHGFQSWFQETIWRQVGSNVSSVATTERIRGTKIPMFSR